MIVGHSYGGAVAILMAAQLGQVRPSWELGVLTLGSPPTGNIGRHTTLPASLSMANIANTSDIVPNLPPFGPTLRWLATMAVGSPVSAWAQWRRPQPVWVLDPNGGMTQTDELPVEVVALANAAIAAVAGNDIDPGNAHAAAEYLRRLQLVRP
jgi:pimeloyl-ACP methyl ester carboxylesterase